MNTNLTVTIIQISTLLLNYQILIILHISYGNVFSYLFFDEIFRLLAFLFYFAAHIDTFRRNIMYEKNQALTTSADFDNAILFQLPVTV
jgi:hypothetical protein